MSYLSAILVVLAAAALAMLVTLAIQRRVGMEFRRHHHDVGSVVFLQLGVVFAVLLAFVFSEAWSEYNAAGTAIDLEVGALHGAAMIAATLPEPEAGIVLSAERRYVAAVIDREWAVMAERRTEDLQTDEQLDTMFTEVADLQLVKADELGKKGEILRLVADAHAARESRIFQASNGIPAALWMVLIGFTTLLALFVSFSAIAYKRTSVALAACFTLGIVSILVVLRLLDYPFEGALALQPADFRDVLGKILRLAAQHAQG